MTERGSFLQLPLYARALAAELIKLCDDEGRIVHGAKEPWEAIAFALGATRKDRAMLREHVPMLLAEGYLVAGEGFVQIKNFVTAQTFGTGSTTMDINRPPPPPDAPPQGSGEVPVRLQSGSGEVPADLRLTSGELPADFRSGSGEVPARFDDVTPRKDDDPSHTRARGSVPSVPFQEESSSAPRASTSEPAPAVPPAPRPMDIMTAADLLKPLCDAAGEAFPLKALRSGDQVALARVLRDRFDAVDPKLLRAAGLLLGDPSALRSLFPSWRAVQAAGRLTFVALMGRMDAAGEPEATALADVIAAARAKTKPAPVRIPYINGDLARDAGLVPRRAS